MSDECKQGKKGALCNSQKALLSNGEWLQSSILEIPLPGPLAISDMTVIILQQKSWQNYISCFPTTQS